MKKIIGKIYSKYLSVRFKINIKNVWLLQKGFVGDYKKCHSFISFFKIYLIHKRGFTVSDWNALNLNKHNYKKYLCNVDYYKMHPLNGLYSKWIDDKLTLKYLCSGSELDFYMPKYYFQINETGKILKLMDYDLEKGTYTPDDIKRLLISKKTLAIKLFNGSLGKGFYKAEYKNNRFYTYFCKKISSLKNYLITEYFKPNDYFSKFSKKAVNSLRVIAGRVDGTLEVFNCHLRLGTKASGFVENYNSGGVLSVVDSKGNFNGGYILDSGIRKKIKKHPDKNMDLKGTIPNWNRVLDIINKFDKYFPQLVYLGFDIVLNDKDELKILEINSLSSLDILQSEVPIFESSYSEFFKEKIK